MAGCGEEVSVEEETVYWLAEIDQYTIGPMQAFDVSLNGSKLCVAGIGDNGVLSADVTSVTGKARGDDLFLHVGGLVSPIGVHVTFVKLKHLQVGDEILIKIVETDLVDEHIEKQKRNSEPPLA